MIDWNAHACSPHSGSGEMRGAAQAQRLRVVAEDIL